jgi:dihydroorotate dehydrogenase (NAD+) catalytic subunit
MNTEVNISGIKMKNPVMTASGTFGYGEEYCELIDLDRLGAIVTKAATLEAREGNPYPRICETSSGMINSIGLQNYGIDWFLENAIPFLQPYKTEVIVNLSEASVKNFASAAKRFEDDSLARKVVSGLEINVSCPNVEGEGMAFGTDPKATYDVVQAVREVTDKPLITKLTPNVTNIVEVAEAACEAGTDALSMINTLLGMAIDVKTRKPRIHGGGRYMGGLSGPATRPVGVRCVYQVHKSGIPNPIVGIGGIENTDDALEYVFAGANAVGIGTATFKNPRACIDVIEGIEQYMRDKGVDDFNDLVGAMEDL